MCLLATIKKTWDKNFVMAAVCAGDFMKKMIGVIMLLRAYFHTDHSYHQASFPGIMGTQIIVPLNPH